MPEYVNEACSTYYPLIEKYEWDKDTAVQVMMAESGCVKEAVNWADSHKTCSASYSLFQIACMHAETYGYTLDDLYKPEVNIEIAYKLWSEQGWSPWTTYTSGKYLKYATTSPQNAL